MPHYLLRVDGSAQPLVKVGERAESGQLIGRSCRQVGYEVATIEGTVRHVEFDAVDHLYLVFIEMDRPPAEHQAADAERALGAYRAALHAEA